MRLSSSASMMSMFSSPGMPNTYSTPSFSRHFTSSSAAFMMLSGRCRGLKRGTARCGVAVRTLALDAADDRLGEVRRRRLPAEVACPDAVLVHGAIDRITHPLCQVRALDVLEHQRRRVH